MSRTPSAAGDGDGERFDLGRFVAAQDDVWPGVLAELGAGRKRGHWMWFVFPQHVSLGRSATARRYGIASAAEARAYVSHPLLGARLREAARLVVDAPGDDLRAILGTPDDLKFRSSMTLFAAVAPDPAPYRRALERFCGGVPDPLTVAALAADPDAA